MKLTGHIEIQDCVKIHADRPGSSEVKLATLVLDDDSSEEFGDLTNGEKVIVRVERREEINSKC